MGEYADQIIDGFVDQYTGEVIDGHSPGYPRQKRDESRICKVCGKRLKSEQGLRDHQRDTHDAKARLSQEGPV